MFRVSLKVICVFLIWSCSDQIEIDCASLNIKVSSIENPTVCSPPNGSIHVFANGGRPPYSFRLNDGMAQLDSLFAALQGGSYQVEVVDANQCSTSIAVTLSNFGSDLSATFSTVPDTDCISGNGQVSFIPIGGILPYKLRYQNVLIENGLQLSGLKHGIHQATIIDAQSCEFVIAINIPKGTTNTSWSLDIKPIIDTRCAKPVCHVAGTGRADLSVLSNVQQLASEIKSRTQNGSMPFDAPMPISEVQLIACWVEEGAQNN